MAVGQFSWHDFEMREDITDEWIIRKLTIILLPVIAYIHQKLEPLLLNKFLFNE